MPAKKKVARKKVVSKKTGKPLIKANRLFSVELKEEAVAYAKEHDNDGGRIGASLAAEKYGTSSNVVHGWASKLGVTLRRGINVGQSRPGAVRKKVPTTEEIKEELGHLEKAEALVVAAQEKFDIARKQLAELEKARDHALKRIRKRLL